VLDWSPEVVEVALPVVWSVVVVEPEPVTPVPLVDCEPLDWLLGSVLLEPEFMEPEPVVLLPEPEFIEPEPVVLLPEPEFIEPEPVVPEPVAEPVVDCEPLD
jgi:hypothetical protein